MIRFYEKICNTLLRAIAIHMPGDRRICHPQVNVLNQRFDLVWSGDADQGLHTAAFLLK